MSTGCFFCHFCSVIKPFQWIFFNFAHYIFPWKNFLLFFTFPISLFSIHYLICEYFPLSPLNVIRILLLNLWVIITTSGLSQGWALFTAFLWDLVTFFLVLCMLTNFGLYLGIVNITLWRLCNLLYFLKSVIFSKELMHVKKQSKIAERTTRKHKREQYLMPMQGLK